MGRSALIAGLALLTSVASISILLRRDAPSKLLSKLGHPFWSSSVAAVVPARLAVTTYATDAVHLCNAMFIATTIRDFGTVADIVLLVNEAWYNVTQDPLIERLLREVAPAHNITLRFGSIWTAGVQTSDGTWRESLTKLHMFELLEYDRVVYLDSDAMVKRSPDELFHLPEVPIAAPRAYWLDKPDFLDTALVVVKPSLTLHARLLNNTRSPELGYDMERINMLAAEDHNPLSILPTRPYLMLSGELNAMINHERYMTSGILPGDIARFKGDLSEEWNATKAHEETMILHFSDWPLPKPWLASQGAIDAKAASHCGNDPWTGDWSCEEGRLWHQLYDEYRTKRRALCYPVA